MARSELGLLFLRGGIALVYLYALYRNTRDRDARTWLVAHTGYVFPNVPEPRRTSLAKTFAMAGAMTMLTGGLSVLLGLEGRAGALLLLVFTAVGVYQHAREIVEAAKSATALESATPPTATEALTQLRWSAFAGNFSSALKNLELCAACVALALLGTGPYSISDGLAAVLGR